MHLVGGQSTYLGGIKIVLEHVVYDFVESTHIGCSGSLKLTIPFSEIEIEFSLYIRGLGETCILQGGEYANTLCGSRAVLSSAKLEHNRPLITSWLTEDITRFRSSQSFVFRNMNFIRLSNGQRAQCGGSSITRWGRTLLLLSRWVQQIGIPDQRSGEPLLLQYT